jgi:hypothetical protein
VHNPHRAKELARLRYDLESLERAADHERNKRNRSIGGRWEFQFSVESIRWCMREIDKLKLRLYGKPKPKTPLQRD